MKKMFFMGLVGTAMCASLASCSNEEDLVNDVKLSQLNIEVGINGMNPNSRAGITAEGFSGNEALGLYIYRGEDVNAIDADNRNYVSTYANGDIVDPKGNILNPTNIQYARANDGKWGSQTPIILSNVNGTVYSYYPFAADNNTNDGKTIPVTVNATQGSGQSDGTKDETYTEDSATKFYQIDYMWGTPVTKVSNDTEDIEISMNHALAMLSFKFNRDTYPGDGKVSSIKVYNATDKKVVITGGATMNIKNGAITHQATPNYLTGVTINPTSETLANDNDTQISAAETPRMLVYPMTVETFAAGDAKFEIVLDNKTFTLNVPTINSAATDTESYKWKAGNNYIYTFKLIGHELVVESVSIKKWTENELEMGSTGDMTVPDTNPTSPNYKGN